MENFPPNFVAGFLRLHNEYRIIHDVPPLKIDEKLNEYAQEWADVLAEKRIFEYRPEKEYGENLYKSTWKKSERDIKPTDPLESWYREGRFFMYGEDQPPSLEYTRHFTQLIWKGSKTIGLGIANDSDGIIYFVCNYDPPGNVEGEFAKNVLPMKQQKGQELLPHEAEGILIVESRPEVVRSMERLYAVPSEKLRVWSIWLTKIVEIADEWQKWLRAHIDFTVRLSDSLYAARLAIRRSEMEMAASKTEASKTEYAVHGDKSISDFTGVDRDESIYEEATDMPAGEETDEAMEERASKYKVDKLSAKSKVTLAPASSVTLTPSRATLKKASAATLSKASKVTIIAAQPPTSKKSSKTSVRAASSVTSKKSSKTSVRAASSVTSKKSSKTSVRAASSVTSKKASKTSVRAASSGTSKKASKTSVRAASSGTSKKASRTTVKSKGKSEAEERMWPIGSPWEHLGEEEVQDEEEVEKLPLPGNEQEMREFLKKFTHQATIYRSYYKHWKETADQATKEIGGRLVLATYKVQGKDETGRIKKPIRPRRCSNNVRAKSPQKGFVKKNDEKSNASIQESPTDESDKASIATSRPENPSRGDVKEQSQVRLDKESQKSIEVPDWVRDCARALEPIPYIFYVKAEPDIDIAIEHDDEEVILADLDRESVAANGRRVFFNLAEKPCKGGKPWI